MKNSKTIEAIAEKVDHILADKAVQLETLQKNIAEQDAAINAAEDILMNAVDRNISHEEYTAAKRSRYDAECVMELCRKKLFALTEEPLIPKEEYEQQAAAIRAALEEENAAAMTEVQKLSAQLQEIGNKLSDRVAFGNDLLCKLQRDIMNDPMVKGDFAILPKMYKGAGRTIYLAQLIADNMKAYGG